MSIFFPDTSTLMSLFDETEPLHNRARDTLRQYKIKDVFMPATVQTEWQSRAMREHRQLVLQTIILMDGRRREGKLTMTVREFNILSDSAASKLREKPNIEGRKLDRARRDLQKEIASSFKTKSGDSITHRPVDDLKEQILRLNYAFYEKGMSVIGFFIQHGYSHPDIKEDVEKAVKQFMSEHRIDLETQDSMILGDLLRYVASDSEDYDFVVGDKNFFKKGQNYIKLYDGVTYRVTFKLLSSI